jgi:hypothetical protein
MSMALHFDEATHRYTLDGRELISVTQALTEAGFIDARWYNDEAALRGTYTHAAIALHHEGALAAASIDPIVRPFFEAYLKFLGDTGYVIAACEERVCDPMAGYAGTLDLRGRFPGNPCMDVIDIKTGAVPPWVGYQTAAYARLVKGTKKRRWALHLRADGLYRLEPLVNRTDERVFLAALTVAQAKRGWL